MSEQVILDRIVLALRATAGVYDYCAPSASSVLGTLAKFIENPQEAERAIESRKESMVKSGLMR